MTSRIATVLLGCLLVGALGCAKPRVWMPPRVDLRAFGTLGMLQLDASPAFASRATQQFVASLHSAQGAVPVLELGALPAVLEAVGHDAIGPDAVRAIGERYRVDALILGDLEIEQPRPSFQIESITAASARADILGTLNARILDARSGATIWSDRAEGRRTIARVDVVAGHAPDFGAVDPEGEQAHLVEWLVIRVTDDFRGYWARP